MPPGELHPQAQIRVLAVHEIPLVESAQGTECLRVQQQAHARQPIEIGVGAMPLPAQPARDDLHRGRNPPGRIGRSAVDVQNQRGDQAVLRFARR